MILYIASILIFLVVSFNLFFRADCGAAVKIAGTLLIFLISMKYGIYRLIGGAFFSPELSRTFIIVMEALYGSLILLFFLLLLWDLYLAGNWLLARAGIPVPRHIPSGVIKCGLVALALLLGSWGTWESIRVPAVRQISLTIPRLPQALDGFSIVQLTDLHIGPVLNRAWLEKVVEKTNSLEPDLIAITGDFVDGRVSRLASELQPLADLKSKYGVFGVTGNHEYYWNVGEWREALNNLGVRMLENEHKSLGINGETLVVAGIPDLVAERFGEPLPDIKAAFKDAPAATRILLAHQPKNAREYAAFTDLHLSGHTHGGLMFFLQPLIARFNNGFVSGMYNVGADNLYVSAGTGLWNGFSSRVGVPSEITRIVLKTPEGSLP